MGINGSIEETRVSMILRDFSSEKMKERIQTVKTLAEAAAITFGGKAEVAVKEQYKNMKPALDRHPEVVGFLKDSYRAAGVEPESVPIRGGTDGSRLTEMGIPCPNIFTGGHNFHGRYEWVSLDQMSLAADVLINLAQKITEHKTE